MALKHDATSVRVSFPQALCEILLPSAVHLEERPGKQASRQKHPVSVYFQWQAWLHAVGRMHSARTTHSRMVMQPTTDWQVSSWNPVRPTAGRIRKVANWESHPEKLPTGDRNADTYISSRLHYHSTGACSYSHCFPHCLEPFDHKLLTPPPDPTQKCYPVSGDRGLGIKKSIGGWSHWAK